MKSYLKIYLKFAFFILITFTIISLILAAIISFIHLSNFLYHTIINLLSAIIMIIWGFLIVKTFPKNTIFHALLCGLIFAIISCMLNINDLRIINILSRPFILISTVLILTFYRKKLEA